MGSSFQTMVFPSLVRWYVPSPNAIPTANRYRLKIQSHRVTTADVICDSQCFNFFRRPWLNPSNERVASSRHWRDYNKTVIVQVCRADGVVIGKFEEVAFQDKMRRGELPVASGQYSYWREGMSEWKPLSEYRPPGKITKILEDMKTRREELKSSSPKSNPPQESVLKKFTSAFRARKNKTDE